MWIRFFQFSLFGGEYSNQGNHPAEIQEAIDTGWDVNEPDPRHDETALIAAFISNAWTLPDFLSRSGRPGTLSVYGYWPP